MARVIVGGVGYPDLRDHSAGLEVAARLAQHGAGADVVVENLSYNPIAVMQRLDDEPAHDRFGRAILVAAVARGGGRTPGTVTAYRWDGVLPEDMEIHRAVCDAVTGVIHVDNTLIVTRHFEALPADVAVVEIEPLEHAFGQELSDVVAAAVDAAVALVRRLAADGSAMAALPLAPLGGGATAESGAA